MATTQMNLRLDAETKKQGDSSFAAVGYSPTQAVRAFWDFAAAHAHDTQALQELMQQVDESNAPAREERKERVRKLLASCADLREELDNLAGQSCGEDDFADRNVRGEAILSRWAERGLL